MPKNQCELYSVVSHCFKLDEDGITAFYTSGFLFAACTEEAEYKTMQRGLKCFPEDDGFFHHVTAVMPLLPEAYARLLQEYNLSDGLELWRE